MQQVARRQCFCTGRYSLRFSVPPLATLEGGKKMAESIDNSNVERETGLSCEQRWQVIQHFTEWIKHGDSKIQMLLTVQGVIVAAYGALVPNFLSKQDVWNPCTLAFNIIFAFSVLVSFGYGFSALQPYTKAYGGKSSSRNVFYYGSYVNGKKLVDLDSLSEDKKKEYLSEQISVLGLVASEKFSSIVWLQYLIFFNVILLVPVFISLSLVR